MATQAKSNIAVSNDCTSGVFTPNAVITINGTDRTTSVRPGSLRVNLARNEQPDSAEFIINRDGGFTPTAGQSVGIGLGDYANYLFAGQIDTIRHERIKVADSPDYAVTCIDWSRLFNRRLITADFSGQSATTIATTIVNSYTSGFTTYGISSGLATVDEFVCINEEPMAALTRLAFALGGGCFIGPSKIVYLWDSSGPDTAYAPSAPATLTNSLSTLKRFVPEYDTSQLRTRAIVEGASIECPVTVPAAANVGTTVATVINGALVALPFPYDATFTFNQTTSSDGNFIRVGPTVFEYDQASLVVGPPATSLLIDVPAGTTSPGTAAVVFNNLFDLFPGGAPAEGFVHDGSGHFFYISWVFAGSSVYMPPAGDYGALDVDLLAGAPIYAAHQLDNVVPQTASGRMDLPIAKGDPIIVRMQKDDTTAQSAIAAIEGGDGVHEHFVSDSTLTYVGCAERATAELDTFSDALLRAEWVTHDPQAVPGAQQVINLSSPAVLSATLTIDSVLVEFLVDVTAIASSPTAPCDSNLWPRRTCQGSTVKLETILDAIKG